MKARFLEFWQGLNPRERWLVGGGALVLLVMLLYAFAWQPVASGDKRLRARLPQLRADAAAVQAGALEVQRLRAAAPAVPPPDNVQAALEAAVRGANWQNATVQPVDATRARVIVPSVEFDRWVAWVGRLRTEQRLLLDSGEIEALPSPGLVKVNAVFATPAMK